MPDNKIKRGRCGVCRREMNLNKDGTVRHHSPQARDTFGHRVYRCEGAGQLPLRTQYGVRWKPDGPVFAYGSRAEAEQRRDEKGYGVLVFHEGIPHRRRGDAERFPWTEWAEVGDSGDGDD